MNSVRIEHSDGRVEEREFPQGSAISVGREQDNSIVLSSPQVSRRHVEIQVNGQSLTITDSSANGTQVGGQRVRKSQVQCPLETPIGVGPFKLFFGGNISAASQPSAQSHSSAQSLSHSSAQAQPSAASKAGAAAPSFPSASQPSAQAFSNAPAPAAHSFSQPAANAFAPSPVDAAAKQAANEAKDKPKPKRQRPAYRANASGTPAVEVSVEVRRQIHQMLLENLDLASIDENAMNDESMRPKVRAALRRILTRLADVLPKGIDSALLIDEITDEALGLGPLEQLLDDESVSEVMVVDPKTIYIERSGRIELTGLRFTDDNSVRAAIERIVTPLGRRIDESSPLVDARLKDGSRVNAIIPPLALRGPCITIRKFSKEALEIQNLIDFKSLTAEMARFLTRSVIARKNIIVSGGTGSGKTTLLNVLSGSIPEFERIVTIEDAAELRLPQPHVVSLESRPPNMEGKGEYSIRDLVKNALRMRPDRIIVGECRSGEALDMLQAMNTGHEGSMTTTHANSPLEALSRLETLVLMAGVDLPLRAAREQIAGSIDLIVQQTRFTSDGSRRITSIAEVSGLEESGEYRVYEIFRYVRTGTSAEGDVLGSFQATGYLPSFLSEFISKGLVTGGEFF